MQREYIGFGSIKHLNKILSDQHAQKIFLVTGRLSAMQSCVRNACETLSQRYQVTRFHDFLGIPTIEVIERGIKAFNTHDHDTVIAIGGGRVIDVAKCINVFTAQSQTVRNLIKQKSVLNSGKYLIAIPTTAGSGSEATQFATLYIDDKKQSLDALQVLPNAVILDPTLTATLPKKRIAISGMDAFCQAIESFWSIQSTTESKNLAIEAIRLILQSLKDNVLDSNSTHQLNMAKAANLAGKAINITRTTAPHAVSYPLTALFNIPHGHAVALTLPSFLRYNGEINEQSNADPRGVEYVRGNIMKLCATLNATDAEAAANNIEQLIHDIGLETRLNALGVHSKSDLDRIVDGSFAPKRMQNNPRKIDKTRLTQLLQLIVN